MHTRSKYIEINHFCFTHLIGGTPSTKIITWSAGEHFDPSVDKLEIYLFNCKIDNTINKNCYDNAIIADVTINPKTNYIPELKLDACRGDFVFNGTFYIENFISPNYCFFSFTLFYCFNWVH